MPEFELPSRPPVHISLIAFDQDEDGKQAIVKFEILDGREDEGRLLIQEDVHIPDSCEDFDLIIRNAAKTLHARLLKATAHLAEHYGL